MQVSVVTHPAVSDLLNQLSRNTAFSELTGQLLRRNTQKLALSGLTTTAKAVYLTLIWQATERPLIVVVDGNKQAEALAELMRYVVRPADGAARPASTADHSGAGRAAAPAAVAALGDHRADGRSDSGGWRTQKVPGHDRAGRFAAPRTEASGVLPAAGGHAAHGRRDPARHADGAPGVDRVRATRAGRDDRRVLGARRNPGRFPG